MFNASLYNLYMQAAGLLSGCKLTTRKSHWMSAALADWQQQQLVHHSPRHFPALHGMHQRRCNQNSNISQRRQCCSPTPPPATQFVAMWPSSPYELLVGDFVIPMYQSTMQILPLAPACACSAAVVASVEQRPALLGTDNSVQRTQTR
jgi:hypothetical protein